MSGDAGVLAFGPVPRLRQLRLWLSGAIASRYDGLHHFGVVDPGVLMRCGQPRVRELEEIRRRFGLATLVVARGGTRHPLRGAWFRKEKAFAERCGVKLIHMPFSDRRMPPADVFDRFVQVMQDAPRPVLVHCEQGRHRTGALCAAYRIAAMRWTTERALREMQRTGFDPADPKRQVLADALRKWAAGRGASGGP